MHLFQQTQLATQKAYLNALNELNRIQIVINKQENLIEALNKLTDVYAEPHWHCYREGPVDLAITLASVEQMTATNHLIELYGWKAPVPHAETEPSAIQQIWLAFGEFISPAEQGDRDYFWPSMTIHYTIKGANQ